MKYKIAVASSDGKMVDTHFGHASSFIIYEVNEEDASYSDIEEREVRAACGGGECGANHDGQENTQNPMDIIASQLSDVDYVLVARIGMHAIRALAKQNITAFDIVLPIDEAISKINGYRKKIAERKRTLAQSAQS